MNLYNVRILVGGGQQHLVFDVLAKSSAAAIVEAITTSEDALKGEITQVQVGLPSAIAIRQR